MACTGVGLASVLAMDNQPSRPGDAGRSPTEMETYITAFSDPHSLDAGNVWCLHLERIRQLDGLKRRLSATAHAKHKTIAFTTPVRWRSWFHRQWHRNDPASWLAATTSLSRTDAQDLIDSAPIPICKRLTWNAGDARGILMAAAAIYDTAKPDVIAYMTAGCSPVGVSAMHEFVSTNASDRCILHMSLPAYTCTDPTPIWICPQPVTCIS